MNKNLKIAIPTVNKEITLHFGHCNEFAILDVIDNQIINEVYHEPPVHQPGVYPSFLAGLGVNVIIAGGMGQKAQDLFAMNNIQVYLGLQAGTAKELTEQYLQNSLNTGNNLCDH